MHLGADTPTTTGYNIAVLRKARKERFITEGQAVIVVEHSQDEVSDLFDGVVVWQDDKYG